MKNAVFKFDLSIFAEKALKKQEKRGKSEKMPILALKTLSPALWIGWKHLNLPLISVSEHKFNRVSHSLY